VLAVLLARHGPGGGELAPAVSRAAVWRAVDRWERAGLARVARLVGRTWVVPTRAGLTVAGLDFAVWEPKVTTLDHVHAVGLVRLAVEPTMPAGGQWISKRALRREYDQLLGPKMRGHRLHLADAAIEAPETLSSEASGDETAPRVAVEVELTRKEHRRLPWIVRELHDSGYVRMIWFAAPDVLDPLRATLARVAPRDDRLEVRPLPGVQGVSYGGSS
jgi:hypothetical protein